MCFMTCSQRLQSPIHIAAEQGYSEICKLLLSAGANIEQREQVNINLVYMKRVLSKNVRPTLLLSINVYTFIQRLK